jgi:ADP-heptose:LPS heptosyltransferase
MNVDPRFATRILIIKLRGIGDVLLSTAVTANLRRAFPDSRIDFLTEPPSVEVLNGNAFLDEIVVFDRRRMSGPGLIRMVRSRRYSMVIDLFGNPRTALVTRCSGARYRVGYRFRFRSYAYNILVTPRGAEVHNVQFNLDALDSIGVAIQNRNLYFPVASADEQFADRFFREAGLEGKTVAAMNASGGWYTKRWSIDRFSALADRLFERHGVSVVVIWGPGEEEQARKILEEMKHPGFLIPPTTLKQLGAVLNRCAIMVSNDSGPLHIAAAVGTPVLGIYGPTNPALQGPYGAGHMVVSNEKVPCLGCNLTECPIGHPCMVDLSVETVLEKAEAMLRKEGCIG